MSDGGGSDSVTQSTEPWEGQQPYIRDALQRSQQLFQTYRPEYYPESTVAPFTQPQLAAQQYLQDYAQGVQPLIGAGQQTAGFLAGGGAMDVGANPYVRGAGQALTGQISDRLMSEVLPSIRSQYRPGQAFGGSRENLAVGRAVQGATREMGDALRQLYGGAYGQGLQATGQALQTLPQMAQLGAYPAQLLSGAGQEQRAFEQARIQDAMDRYRYYQDLPYDRLNRYIQSAAGQQYGAQTTGPGQGSSTNPFAGALGGAATGAAIGSAVPVLGTGLGAALGGGLGLLGGLF